MKKDKVRKVAFRLKQRCGDHVEDGKTYVAGDKVMSCRNLEKLFRNKFERVHPEEDFDFAEASPNIPSPRAVLDKDKGEGDRKPPSSKSKKLKNSKKFGKNITLSFPAAIEAELRVYEKASWCQVVDWNTEDGKSEVVSEKKLREKDVEEFLKDYVEPVTDDDDDDDSEDDDEDE